MENLTGQYIKGYELQERIAAGGFGAVYRAYQSTVGREVAVKVILPGLANKPEFVRRFEAEAQLIARLEHPFIVPLHDYWRDPDGAYLVMRYLRGGSLYEYLHKTGALSIEETLNLFTQITQALHVAHRNQVIHRDIKPGNILLDEDKNAYLADFGIAKDYTTSHNITEPEAFIGSPEYLSPEQARSEAVTPQTDIYSLGVVLYEMLSGQHPFPNLQKMQVLFKHLNDKLPEITTLDDAVSNEMNAVIQKATAKNPDNRYRDVMEMLQALSDAAKLTMPTTPSSIVELLTPREQEVLQLIMDGKSNRQIADTLVVAETTVKSYITSLYRKLKVRSRVQAIARARDLDFLVRKPSSKASVSTGELPEAENPYKGLRAFQAADAQDYFGREKLTQKLLHRLQQTTETFRFLALIGPSGSGKSSLAKAGLIPALWRGELSQSDRWYIVDFLPGAHPIDELEVALFQVATDKRINLHEHLMRDKRGLIRAADLTLPDDGSELLLVIDQFEEVFTLLENEEERQHFLALIVEAVTDKRSRIRVIITLRADYYDRPLQYSEFGELLRNRVETVLPLSAEELERAISEPAYRVGIAFEDGLVSRIVSDVHYQPSALPLLQYALTELFERRDGLLLTFEAYEAIGGTGGALAKRADDIYLECDEKARELVRQLFLRLVTLGEGAEDTRRRADRAELINIASSPDLMEEIIDIYAASRLLSLDNDPATRQPTIEVAHEAILREWERLRMWLNESRDDIWQERKIAQAASEWQGHRKDNSYLLRGARLEQARKWYAETQLSLTALVKEFISASIRQHEIELAEERERTRRAELMQQREIELIQQRLVRTRALVALLIITAILSLTFAVSAISQSNTIAAALETSQRSSLTFAAKSVMQTGDLDLALALAIAAVGDDDTKILPETQTVLEELANTGGPRYLLDSRFCGFNSQEALTLVISCDDDNRASWFIFNPLTNETISSGTLSPMLFSEKTQVQVSPNNQYFLIAPREFNGDPITVEIWKIADLTLFARFEIEQPVVAVHWAGDSSMIATIDVTPENLPALREQGMKIGDHVSFWDAATGDFIRQIQIDAPYYQYLNFGYGGKIGIVGGWSSFAADKQYQVTIFDSATGATLYQVEREALYHPDYDLDGAGELGFSPDNTIIWFGGYPSYAIDLATGENYGHIHELKLEERLDVPNWDYLASADMTALLAFNPQTDQEFVPPNPNFNFYTHTAAIDKLIVHLYGHDDSYLWDLQGRDDAVATLSAGTGFMPYAKYSPDSQYIGFVAGDYGATEHTVTALYRADTFEEIYRLDYDLNLPFDLAWSPDSHYFATVTDSQGIILWDAQTGQELRRFTYGIEQIPVSQVEFTSDGQYLVSGISSRYYKHDDSPYLLVWNVASGELIKRIDLPDPSSPNYGVHWISMHPNQNLVYVTFNINVEIASYAESDNPQQMASYLVHLDTGAIETIETDFLPYATAFTPDGKELIFSAISDNLVRVYDVQTRAFSRRWQTNQGGISGIAISPDGQFLLTNSSLIAVEPAIKLWDIATGHYVRSYTDAGLKSFLISLDFSPDGSRFVTTALDRSARVWTMSEQSALDWIRANRYIRDFTCVERSIYRIEPLCND